MSYCECTMVERIIVGPLHNNAYVVSTAKKECILIDPGPDAETILRRLEVLNMVPQLIVLTHGHLDHTASTLAIQAHYAENDISVPVGIHKKDAFFMKPDAKDANRAIFEPFGEAALNAFEELFGDFPKIDMKLKDGDTIPETDLVVVHVPGHTPGSVAFYSEERNVVFSGDTLFFKAIGRTDFPESDQKKLEDSIRKKLFTLPPETRLFAGHGPNSSIEREVANNDFSQDHSMV